MVDIEIATAMSKYAKDNESFMHCRDFEYKNKKYYVGYFVKKGAQIKFMISSLVVLPLQLIPYVREFCRKKLLRPTPVENATGFVVLDDKKRLVRELELAKEIVRFYKIWEEVYLDPYYRPPDLSNLRFSVDFRSKSMELIQKFEYPKPKSKEEERVFDALKELDADLIESVPIYDRLYRQLSHVIQLFIEVSDHPKDTTVARLLDYSERCAETFQELEEYTQKRKKNWVGFTQKDEKFNYFKNMGKSPSDKVKDALVEDLIGYVLPFSSTLTTISSESKKVILDRFGGYAALARTKDNYHKKRYEILDFVKRSSVPVSVDKIRVQ